MKRAFPLLSIAAVAALLLGACSSDSAPTDESVVEQASAAPDEIIEDDSTDTDADADTGTEETLAEACLGLTEPLQEADAAILTIAQDETDDPENTVAMWRVLSEAFEDFGARATDPELATLSAEVGRNAHALTDVMETMYVDKDYSVVDDFDAANDVFLESYEELIETCTPYLE